MDDLVSGSKNKEKVKGLYDHASKRLAKGGFRLRKCLHPTKLNILSVLSGLFDPLGIVSSITVAIKALFQELCIQKVGWDDELNESLRERWDSWVKDIVKTKVISFNRCLYYNIEENVLASYLHGFSDASNLAYCAVVYFVYESETGTYVKMLTSKTRVAPLKPLTIPRLELMSAIDNTQIRTYVSQSFSNTCRQGQESLRSSSSDSQDEALVGQ